MAYPKQVRKHTIVKLCSSVSTETANSQRFTTMRCSWSNITKAKLKKGETSLLFCTLIGCLQQEHSLNPSPSPSNHTGALQPVGLPPSRRANQTLHQSWGLPLLLSVRGDVPTYCLSSWWWCNTSQHAGWVPVQLQQATLWNDLE